MSRRGRLRLSTRGQQRTEKKNASLREGLTGVGGDVDAVDLRLLDLALEVGGDPHRAQRALPRQDRVRVEHCGCCSDQSSTPWGF